MKKTYILGNNSTKEWSCGIENIQYVPTPVLSLGENGEAKLSRYLIGNISDDASAFVLDTDSINNPELWLTIAMSIRLSLNEFRQSALAPIIFVSLMTKDVLTGYKYSTIILTDSIYFEEPDNLTAALDVVTPLTSNDYINHFLNIIKILPNATEGRHSLANQWGADVLYRMVTGCSIDNALFNNAKHSLYFKYTYALTLGVKDIENLLNDKNDIGDVIKPKTINANGKKILLIDDEADKGWGDVLDLLFFDKKSFLTICEKVADYESLSDKARIEIEEGDYDLIFLDLRMNGIDEENKLNPEDFSGMKILKAIKGKNLGTQVIMFTSSNNTWIIKALLDAGADGFYIKESPDYAFSREYSENNAKEFCMTIQKCLGNGYLRYVYLKIKEIEKLIKTSSCVNWRPIKEALPDVSLNEKVEMLKNRFNSH